MWQRVRQADRSAVTLIEVLLVLALLVMLASLTWPALDRPMANQRLRKAADKVRTAWARARVDAMSTGQTIVFRCTIEESEYSLETQAGPEAVDSIASSEQGVFAETSGDMDSMSEPLEQTSYTLPESVRFVEGEVAFDTRASILCDADEILTEESSSGSTDSIDPILFYPDGTTSTATLVLENEYQRRVEVSLRGMTGVMTVGEPYTSEEATDVPR